jgi:hypothetical protein
MDIKFSGMVVFTISYHNGGIRNVKKQEEHELKIK